MARRWVPQMEPQTLRAAPEAPPPPPRVRLPLPAVPEVLMAAQVHPLANHGLPLPGQAASHPQHTELLQQLPPQPLEVLSRLFQWHAADPTQTRCQGSVAPRSSRRMALYGLVPPQSTLQPMVAPNPAELWHHHLSLPPSPETSRAAGGRAGHVLPHQPPHPGNAAAALSVVEVPHGNG